jgi:hypothetical protein
MSNDNQIPTAENFLLDYELGNTGKIDIEDTREALIEFAKLHVEAALTAVGNEIIGPAAGSVRDIYPLNNIK